MKTKKICIEFTEEELAYLQEALVESRVGWESIDGNPFSFEAEDWMQELLDKIEDARKQLSKEGVNNAS